MIFPCGIRLCFSLYILYLYIIYRYISNIYLNDYLIYIYILSNLNLNNIIETTCEVPSGSFHWALLDYDGIFNNGTPARYYDPRKSINKNFILWFYLRILENFQNFSCWKKKCSCQYGLQNCNWKWISRYDKPSRC